MSTQQVQGNDDVWYTEIVAIGADGNEYTSYIEPDGDVYNGYTEEMMDTNE